MPSTKAWGRSASWQWEETIATKGRLTACRWEHALSHHLHQGSHWSNWNVGCNTLTTYSLASVILTFAVLNHFRLPHFVNLFSFFFQMTSLWRARILPSVLACSSSGQSTWKEAASKTAHKWMPKLLTPALSICSHFLQRLVSEAEQSHWLL